MQKSGYTASITAWGLFALTVVGLTACHIVRDRHAGYHVDMTIRAEQENPIKAGFAALAITPPFFEPWHDADGNARYEPKKGDTYEDTNRNGKFDTYWMAGFGNGVAVNGVHDDIWARTMVVDDGNTRLAMVALDVIGLFHPTVIEVREMLPPETGITYLTLVATHTHEAPDFLGLWGKSPLKSGVDREWKTYVKERIVQSVVEAVQAMRPATLKFSQNLTDGMATLADTREPHVYDHGLRIIQAVDNENDSTLGTLVQWANHPETLWSRNLLITSDFPHYIRQAVEKGVYDGDTPVEEGVGGIALYVNGAVGGLMTTHASTGVKDPFRDTTYVAPSFDKARAQGDTLGLLILRTMKNNPVEVKQAGISLRAKTFSLPIRNSLFRLAAAIGLMDADMTGWMKKRTEAAAWSIGPAAFLSIPGEIYPEIVNGGIAALPGRDFNVEPQEVPPLRELMTKEFRFVIGLANDEIGYIIPQSQWDKKKPFVYRDKAYYGESNSLGPRTAPLLYGELKRLLSELPEAAADSGQAVVGEVALSDSWFIRSSKEAASTGETLSVEGGFTGSRWVRASVPSTVLGALTGQGIYEEAFFGMNLESIPAERFTSPWWYCRSFDLPRFDGRKEQALLHLDGINYRANIWLNGHKILSADTAFGAFRQFCCDITPFARQEENRIAVEVIPPGKGDFYMGFVDWAPVPPDHNMGIYRPVRIRRSGKAS
ncbi:MAG: hypothetical protein LBQ78_04195, partial [Tannerellaceae bacterium]|nr:hypothetical protein [Tannerellaceae bacterium]